MKPINRKKGRTMKRLMTILLAGLFLMTASAAFADWDLKPYQRDYDSLGIVEISAVGSGVHAATVLDTLSVYIQAKGGINAGELLMARYSELGGGAYTSIYIWCIATDTAKTAGASDSTTCYIVLEQTMGGNTGDVWTLIDSITITYGGVTTVGMTGWGEKFAFNGMPYYRIRTQYHTKTSHVDTLRFVVKQWLIR